MCVNSLRFLTKPYFMVKHSIFAWKCYTDSDDLKYKSPRFGMRMAAGPRVTTTKAQTFADHLRQVFTPHQLPTTDAAIPTFLDVPCQMSSKEVAKTIARTNVRKSPGYDRITGKVLKSYPRRL